MWGGSICDSLISFKPRRPPHAEASVALASHDQVYKESVRMLPAYSVANSSTQSLEHLLSRLLDVLRHVAPPLLP